MRSDGGVVSAFSRVRKPWPDMYTEAVQTSKVPENPREAWDSGTAQGWREDTNYSNISILFNFIPLLLFWVESTASWILCLLS